MHPLTWAVFFLVEIAVFKELSGAADNNYKFGPVRMADGNMIICEGTSPYTAESCDGDPTSLIELFLTQNFAGFYGFPNTMAWMSLCEIFWSLPPLVKLSCEGVRRAGHDSYYMASGGSSILHEMVHYRYLTSQVPNFDTEIGPWPNRIEDFEAPSGVSPKDGYGPQFASQLVGLGDGVAKNNADNYAWYATTAYWRENCDGMVLNPSVDNNLGLQCGAQVDIPVASS